jgi:hypothetical protein
VASTIPPQADAAGFTAGYRVSGYRLEQEIGRGGMAVVYTAYDERLERQVALKVLTPSMAQDQVFRQRFIGESRAAAAVEDPHIIPVYEAGESDGVLFIAMRLVRGGDLRTLVAQTGPLPPSRAEWIVSAVASALDAAHARGLVHRDVKPANMLLDVRPGRPDHVYLSDFGLSKAALSSGGLSDGQFVGTVDYAAPEQILGRGVDGRTDQYALGCGAFELLCGRPPYSGGPVPATLYSHLSSKPPVATAERPELPAAVDAVFARVLAKSPADRYESCQDFALALRAALGLKAYVPEAEAAPGQGHPAPAGSGDSTLHPAAIDRFAAGFTGSAAAGLASPGPAAAGPAAAGPAAAGLATADTDPRITSHLTVGPAAVTRVFRPRRVLVSGVVAVVLLAGAAAAVWFGRAPAARSAHHPAGYQFGANNSNGLEISQLWTLAGPSGSSLDVSMTISSRSSGAVYARLEEPLPPGAAGAGSMTFGGTASPQQMGNRLVWDLDVPGHGKYVVLTYRVPEKPAGASAQQLMKLVGVYNSVAFRQVLVPIPRPGVMPKVWISPDRFFVKAGHQRQLTAHGRLASGKLAPPGDLSGAVWWTNKPGVLVVNSSGTATGERPGTALVYLNVDGVPAQATVVVSGSAVQGSASPPAAGASQPVVQSSTSPVPSTSSPGSASPPTSSPASSPPTSPPPTSGTPNPGASSDAAELTRR